MHTPLPSNREAILIFECLEINYLILTSRMWSCEKGVGEERESDI